MSNVTLSFPEFPDNASLAANTNYVVTMAHPITAVNSIIPENVTLYFYGGRLDAGTTGIGLVGNQTRIIAPIEQIFGTTLKVEGSWYIDRAYPQWFGAKAYFDLDPQKVPNPVDSSDAINKAIIMKQTGEVFLPRGRYIVKKTIFVKHGILLIGDPGVLGTKETDATILLARTDVAPTPPETNTRVENTSFTKGCFIMVNVKHNGSALPNDEIEWEIGWPIPGTVIKQILFRNDSKISRLRCIFSVDNLELYDCIWYYFQQAIACGGYYMDMKRILRCVFNNPGDFHREEVLYAFDMGSLGDALIFENNAINQGDYNKGLRLHTCHGGTISSNIINADVLISDCKGTTFSSNHMEGKSQIKIVNSSASILNNFIYKGDRSNINISRLKEIDDHRSVVNISGNLFLFHSFESNVDKISEYDIKTDGMGIFNLSNNYRYWIGSETPKIYTYGISICQLDGAPYENFNQLSYLLSHESCLTLPNIIENSQCVNGVGELRLKMHREYFGGWQGEDGTYYYGYQIIWDLNRKITTSVSNFPNGHTVPNASGDRNTYYFSLFNGNNSGYKGTIRLFRGSVQANYTHCVDVPVYGNSRIFENGISICGFKWREIKSGDMIIGNTNIEFIRYCNANIECKAPSQPTTGTWQKGDIVYNTSPNGTNSMWIYLGSSGWKAR